MGTFSAGFTYRLYRLYRLKPRASRSKRGLQQTVVRIESMAGIWSFRLNFVKNVCLSFYSRNLVSFNFRSDNARVFQRVSMILNMTVGQAACQLLRRYTQSTLRLRPAFAESYRFYVWLYQKNLWLFMFELHLISGITDGWQPSPLTGANRPPCQAKCKNGAPT